MLLTLGLRKDIAAGLVRALPVSRSQQRMGVRRNLIERSALFSSAPPVSARMKPLPK